MSTPPWICNCSHAEADHANSYGPLSVKHGPCRYCACPKFLSATAVTDDRKEAA